MGYVLESNWTGGGGDLGYDSRAGGYLVGRTLGSGPGLVASDVPCFTVVGVGRGAMRFCQKPGFQICSCQKAQRPKTH